MRAEPMTSSAHLTGWSRRWQRALFDAGLLVPGWPPELGGRNLPPVQQLVYHEEMAKIPVMRSNNPQGLGIIAPSILDYGSDFLKQKYLVPTLRAEIAWCLGMSEPGAGSDLAALSTRAEVHDDHFVVSGQKIWTSGAHHADHCFCFVRTDPDAPKHRGISVLIIDMKATGITHAPAARSHRPRPRRLQRGLLRRRGGAARPPRRPAQPGLVDLGGLAGARARHDVALERRAARRHARAPVPLARERGPDGRRIGESATFRDELASPLRRRAGDVVHGLPGLREVRQGQGLARALGAQALRLRGRPARRARRDRGAGRRRARRRVPRHGRRREPRRDALDEALPADLRRPRSRRAPPRSSATSSRSASWDCPGAERIEPPLRGLGSRHADERHDPGERRRPRLRAPRHVGPPRRPRSGRTARRGSSTSRTAPTSGCSRASRSPTSG